MMTMIIVSPSGRTDFELRLSFDYDPAVVAAIKSVIPKRVRTYDPHERAWYIAQRAAVLLEDVARMSGAMLVDDYEPAAPAQRRAVDPYATMHLLPTAPRDVVSAVYRVLAKRLHPDVGGDLREMQRLNDAFDRILGPKAHT